MECIAELQHEVPEVYDADLLVELLDASVAAEQEEGEEVTGCGKHLRQVGFPVDDVDDGWGDLDSVHPQQEEAGCEDCGLDGIILSSFDLCGCSPAPHVVDDGGGGCNPVDYWTDHEMERDAFGPFTGSSVGEWYMDGMAMEWDDERSYYSFHPYYSGGEACTGQPCGSPLWE
jgi:hypothetical protein